MTQFLSSGLRCGVTAVFAACGLALAAPAIAGGTWEASLQARDLNGDGIVDAYYDTKLQISWLANSRPTEPMDWWTARRYVRELNVHGVTGWRMPQMFDTFEPGCDYGYSGTDCGYNVAVNKSEMAHMYAVTLGNKGLYTADGSRETDEWGLRNNGPFSTVSGGHFWAQRQFALDANVAWAFNVNEGEQLVHYKGTLLLVWPVYAGDVANAPR